MTDSMVHHGGIGLENIKKRLNLLYGDKYQLNIESSDNEFKVTSNNTNMIIKCLALDDEPLALSKMASYISKTPFLELTGACRSGL